MVYFFLFLVGTKLSSSTNNNNGNSLENAVPSRSEHCYDIMRRFEHHQRVSFFKQSKKQFPMFPYQEDKSRVLI